jgi:hypothetical protein
VLVSILGKDGKPNSKVNGRLILNYQRLQFLCGLNDMMCTCSRVLIAMSLVRLSLKADRSPSLSLTRGNLP